MNTASLRCMVLAFLVLSSSSPLHAQHDEHGHEHSPRDAASVAPGASPRPVGDEQGHESGGAEGHRHDEEEGVVKLTPESIQMADIKVVRAQRGRISHAISLTGTVAANEDRTVHLNPKIEGLVREVKKTLGDRVASGEVLVILDSTQLGTEKVEFLKHLQEVQIAELELERRKTVAENVVQLIALLEKNFSPLDVSARTAKKQLGEYRAKLLLAYSSLKLTKGTYDRHKRLFERKVTSEKEMLEARNAYEGAQAQYRSSVDEAAFATFSAHLAAEKDQRTKATAYDAALQHLKILGVTEEEVTELRNRKARDLNLFPVHSPIDGEITEKHVTLGERATLENSMFTIADRRTMWVLADVYEKDLQHVHSGMPAVVEVTAFAGRPFQGKVTVVSPTVDSKTRTVRLRIDVDNKDGLLAAGMFAKIETRTGHEEAVLSIPASAVQEIEGKPTVFVQEGEARFEARTVTVGAKDDKGERIEVFTGLKEGDPVVSAGAFFLRSELAKGEMGHDHEH